MTAKGEALPVARGPARVGERPMRREAPPFASSLSKYSRRRQHYDKNIIYLISLVCDSGALAFLSVADPWVEAGYFEKGP